MSNKKKKDENYLQCSSPNAVIEGVALKGEVNGEDEWRRKSPSFDPARGRSVSPPFRLHSKFTDHRLLAATSVEKN